MPIGVQGDSATSDVEILAGGTRHAVGIAVQAVRVAGPARLEEGLQLTS